MEENLVFLSQHFPLFMVNIVIQHVDTYQFARAEKETFSRAAQEEFARAANEGFDHVVKEELSATRHEVEAHYHTFCAVAPLAKDIIQLVSSTGLT